MSKHTPGPWHVGSASGNVCAGTDWIAAPPEDVEDTSEEWQANARLIAAAPDLLAAAEAALNMCENMLSEEWSRGEDKPVREHLRAAIALAKGKE